jgi:toxin CcdB
MQRTQFALYENKDAASNRRYPYLIDLQTDLLADTLSTRLVAPLAKVAIIKAPIAGLTPVVTFENIKYAIDIPQMAAIRKSSLGSTVGSLANERLAIIGAIDRLITGS